MLVILSTLKPHRHIAYSNEPQTCVIIVAFILTVRVTLSTQAPIAVYTLNFDVTDACSNTVTSTLTIDVKVVSMP